MNRNLIIYLKSTHIINTNAEIHTNLSIKNLNFTDFYKLLYAEESDQILNIWYIVI